MQPAPVKPSGKRDVDRTSAQFRDHSSAPASGVLGRDANLPILSIRQPWVWAILHAGKYFENRPRRSHYRGRFLVHASRTMDKTDYAFFRATFALAQSAGAMAPGIVPPAYDSPLLLRGGICGAVDLVDCVDAVDRPSSPWFFGPYGYRLANPQMLDFEPMRAQLGFFKRK